jgi:hypothetical protein
MHLERAEAGRVQRCMAEECDVRRTLRSGPGAVDDPVALAVEPVPYEVSKPVTRSPGSWRAAGVDLVVEAERVQVAFLPQVQHPHRSGELNEVQMAQLRRRDDPAFLVEAFPHRYPLRVAGVADPECPCCGVEPVQRFGKWRPRP